MLTWVKRRGICELGSNSPGGHVGVRGCTSHAEVHKSTLHVEAVCRTAVQRGRVSMVQSMQSTDTGPAEGADGGGGPRLTTQADGEVQSLAHHRAVRCLFSHQLCTRYSPPPSPVKSRACR